MHYAKEAVMLGNSKPIFVNTLALALEFQARTVADPIRWEALLSESQRLLDEALRRDRNDPYSYLGKVLILKQRIGREPDEDRKAHLQATAVALLEEGYEASYESEVLAGELATMRAALGAPDEAVAILRKALKRAPTDIRLSDLLIRQEIQRQNYGAALNAAMEAAKHDPISWRIQRHIARLRRRSNEPVEAVAGHYEAAIRHNRGDVGLLVELGAYLFEAERYGQARTYFEQAKQLPIAGHEKRRLRQTWRDGSGRAIRFAGLVRAIRGASAFAMATPQNFEAFFWRDRPECLELREGQRITFVVGFNAFGSVARDIERVD